MGLGVRRTPHARQFHLGVHDEQVLNGRRGDVLALGGLEDLLGPSRDLEPPLGVDLPLVPSPEPPVLGYGLLGGLLVLVVPHHGPGSLDLQFPILGKALLHVVVGRADVPHLAMSLFGHVGVVEVLRHTVPLQQLQPQAAVPLDQLGRDGGRSGPGQSDVAESQPAEDLLLDQRGYDGDGEQEVELFLRHLFVDALLELRPEAGDRQEQRRLGPVEVRNEGREGLSEEQLHAGGHVRALGRPPLHPVRQGQVGQVPVVLGRFDALHQSRGRVPHGPEVVHDALGPAGGTGGVDDRRELLAGPDRGLGDRLVLGDQVVPLLGAVGDVLGLGAEGECHDGHVGRDAPLHFAPRVLVQLAHKDQLRLAVLEDVGDGVGRQGRVDGDGDEAAHPDGPVGHQPPGAVLGADRDFGSGFQVEGFEVRRHLLGLVEGLLARPDLHVVASHGLRHARLVGTRLHQGVQGVDEGVSVHHLGCCCRLVVGVGGVQAVGGTAEVRGGVCVGGVGVCVGGG
mmetsp:Transcript_15896/g.32622  ORF Transcript_15896/g.32622 Transcript_15896/m.32622 type:complete len:509 (+) Transcript_15896:521-2047(+)